MYRKAYLSLAIVLGTLFLLFFVLVFPVAFNLTLVQRNYYAVVNCEEDCTSIDRIANRVVLAKFVPIDPFDIKKEVFDFYSLGRITTEENHRFFEVRNRTSLLNWNFVLIVDEKENFVGTVPMFEFSR